MSQDTGGPDPSFEDRLMAARSKQGLDAPPKPSGQDGLGGSAWGIGARVGVELVSALVVAVAIGYGLDRLFHTTPILTAVFVLSAHDSHGVLVMTSAEAQIMLVAEHAFIFAFGASWGPVVWVLLGEMFPNRIRAPALAVSAGTQWVTAFLVTTSFPGLLSSVGLSGLFCIYTIASMAAYWTVFRCVRETKGMVLEDMPDADGHRI